MGNKSFYGKEESMCVAGVAILLMIWHHLFTYQNWLIEGVRVESLLGNNINFLVWLTAGLGNICIFLFAFQSGYAIYKRSDLYNTTKKRFSRIFSFLISYWMVCISFLIFAIVFNEDLPTLHNLLLNLIGIEVGFYSEWVNVTFAWYVLYYILLVLSFPLLNYCFKSNNPIKIGISLVGCICLILILSACGIPGYWKPFMASIAGILTAKYEIFDYLSNNAKKYFSKGWICVSTLAFVLLIRTILLYLGNLNKDQIFFSVIESIAEAGIAFAFIFSFISLIRWLNNRAIFSSLCFIGGISMFLWFLHSILFTGSRFLQNYIYYPKEPVAIFILVLAIFIPISLVFNIAYKYIKRIL